MSNKIISSGELLSNLNKSIDKKHHKRQGQNIDQQKKKEQAEQKKQSVIKRNIQEEEQSKKQNSNKIIKIEKQKRSQQQLEKSSYDKEQRKVIVQSQNRTIRSNLSRASQIKNKKSQFQSNFMSSSMSIEEEESPQSLHELLAMQIGKLISQPLAEVIETAMKQKQNMIYIAYTQPDKQYLENLLFIQKKKQNNNIFEIQSLLNKRQNKTLQKLQKGDLYIDREKSITSKQQIEDLQKMDVARLLKIKEGVIRSKLELLQDKIFQFHELQSSPSSKTTQQALLKYQQEKIEQITDPNNFSLTSQKTKIAHDYVRHLQHQKLILLKKMRERQQKRNQLQKQRSIQLKEAQQMRNAVKKQQVQQRIGQYKKKRQSQTNQIHQKSKQVEQFLKQYRKSLPLYKKKEKQYHEYTVKNKQKEIQQKLKSIRQNRRSLSLNQIKDHQDKYLQRKSLQQSKKQEQFKMLAKAKKAQQSVKQYFKGFYHDKVKILDQQQKLKFYSLRQSSKLKIERITEFDKQIRKLHKPKIDEKKKEQVQRRIQLQELKKKKVKKVYKQVEDENGQTKLQAYYEEIPQINNYKEGNKYMQIAKSLAKKIKPQTESRYSEQPVIQLQQLEESKIKQKKERQRDKDLQDWETPSPIISQEKDIWRLRSKQMHQMTDDINAHNFYQVKKNLEVMDDKAKMKEQLLKHKDSDVHEIIHEKSMLDEFYLESIKNKIKLLNE